MERRPFWRFAFFFLSLTASVFASDSAGGTNDYVEQLVRQAVELRLDQDPYWHVLGHYRPRTFGGWKSLIDDPLFFNDPNGKYDPQAELSATIRAFFQPLSEDPEARHPVCRFPARLAWLRERLAIDSGRMPVPTCVTFDEVYAYIKPRSVTLAFPAAYMNSPASMFGHTLLVVDGTDRNRLLSKGVGYAAAVTTGIGPVFAIKGIFGLYPGRFNVESYYDKVEQYNDIHRRDIWEYELDLNQDEVDRMFRHMWEVQNIWSWYYFFDENCAYKLYQLIDAARPGLDLSREHPWFVIPVDAVKLIVERNLVREVTFRPSKTARMESMLDQLPKPTGQKALAVARGKSGPDTLADDAGLSDVDKRVALDLSADYTQYLYTSERIPREEYGPRFLGILKARSRLGPRTEEEGVVTPPARPEEGHEAAMVSPGIGMENGTPYFSLNGRIAYHELLDNDTGFTRGAQILFLNTDARWKPEDNAVELRSVDVVSVESLSPRNELFTPVSWRVRMSFTQMDRRDDQDSMIFQLQTGGGGSWALDQRHLVYALFETELHAGPRYESYIAGGPGFSAGWIYSVNRHWKWLVQARTAWIYEGNDDWWRVEAAVGQDWQISRDRSIRATYRYTQNGEYDIHEGGIGWNLYF